jgi:energy-coupling factor transporter ATP-binding protein EcfA2
MRELQHFVRVDFMRFKAFKTFTLHLRHFNILVGPNNAGKSTVLAAFRILASAMRKASNRKPEVVAGPSGDTLGYRVDVSSISIAEENIFYNYDDLLPATIGFRISNGNQLLLYFGNDGHCNLIAQSARTCNSPATFCSQFNCPIGFAPILGPVDHNEQLYEKEAARRALLNYTASRNFRNIWHHYPDKFDEFRATLVRTWPGMDIEPPTIDYSHSKPRLSMFCPEERIPREIFWAGFGFQVWCQMLTHLIQSSDKALFLIDEPDIYLHSDLQRQLLGILRTLGPDILIATHSTEIITEAEPDDIVLVDKRRQSARRLKNPSQLTDVFSILGSNLNPILTQLAKTRRAVFVEGKDFQILGRFAQKLKVPQVSTRTNFAVVPVEGFNPQRIRNLKAGMETTLGGRIQAAAILDRDYRSDAERNAIGLECSQFCDYVTIHKQKEIENFLLVPNAIDRAAGKKVADRAQRSGQKATYSFGARQILDDYATERKDYVMAQHLAERRRFERTSNPAIHEAAVNEVSLREFNASWQTFETRMSLIPGKDALSYVNQKLQQRYAISVTPSSIIDAMLIDEIPSEVRELVAAVNRFASNPITD